MKASQLITSTLLMLFAGSYIQAMPHENKPRVIILTDIENEPDDAQSLVRFLTYSNMFDVDGIIATTSVWLKDKTAEWRILEILDAYEKVQPKLLKHEAGYPTGEELRSRTKVGIPLYGIKGVGEGKDSEGSDWIIQMLRKEDPRPLWVLAWGGPNCLAQALWKLEQTESPEELGRLVKKLRVYTISDQDDSGPWMRRKYPDLFYICSPGYAHDGREGYHFATWSGISGDTFHGRFQGGNREVISKEWIRQNIQANHGPLGAEYPDVAYLMEGDTPSFLYLINNGLGNTEHPNYGSWGGRYESYLPKTELYFFEAETRPLWTNAADEVYSEITGENHTGNQATIWRWREAFQNDFAARMDWCSKSYDESNHPPMVSLAHDEILNVCEREKVKLKAYECIDPDGDKLSYHWIYYREAGNSVYWLKMENEHSAEATFTAPVMGSPQEMHFILAVTDDGKPALTRYKRVMVKVRPEVIKPRIIVLSDINNVGGDPDDKQSMAHLLMYANEVEIKAIIPDYWKGKGVDATKQVLNAYEADYMNPDYAFRELAYPHPDMLRAAVAKEYGEAVTSLITEALKEDNRPLYLLVWGGMSTVRDALFKAPEIAGRIRVLTIATNVMADNPDSRENAEVDRFCKKNNWNGRGRDDIFNDPRFTGLWWIENDWAYNGMFEGKEPAEFLLEIKEYGQLGFHMWEVVQSHHWAHYFRAGDTPTLLYLLEQIDHNDPSQSSWAGKFIQPFPGERPSYWIDDAGMEAWNYKDPCTSWDLAGVVYKNRVRGLLDHRADMYDSYKNKMNQLYKRKLKP